MSELERVRLTRTRHLWQRKRGHRTGTDDILCAWAAHRAAPEGARRALELGAGQGAVSLILTDRLPDLHITAVEAQVISYELLERNVRENLLTDRYALHCGDLRRLTFEPESFDLVFGTPPFMPMGSGTLPQDAQRAAARFEMRGGVEAYCEAAARALREGGGCAIVMDAARPERYEAALESDPIGELERLYKLGSEASRADEAVAAACRAELAALQQGDPARKALWERFVAISRADAEAIYERMNVSFDTWHGESFYHDDLPGIVESLQSQGLARESEGAIAVFFEDIENMADKPFLIRKSDGAFLYATTDLATLNYRLKNYEPSRVIYVVDVRQSLHFNQLFETFRRMGNQVELSHVGFGMMLGADGRPFRTRDGGTITLSALLDEAESRILPKVEEKWPESTSEERSGIASQVGIGAVKYADLSHNLTTDYRFDWDKLLAADGNTGPYLQYTVVRLRSVLREYEARFGETFVPAGTEVHLGEPEEVALAKAVLQLGDTLDTVSRTLRPHFLCDAVYGIARSFNPFYAKCSILGAPDEATRRSRLALCHATVSAMEIGLSCLNIPIVEKM